MLSSELTRRAALASFGAFVVVPATVLQDAMARPGLSAGIRVDVNPLRANAGDPTAAWVAREMPGALAQALAADGRGGAGMSVRIDYVILGSSTGGECGPSHDQMVGAVIVRGVEKPLRSTTSYFPSPVDQALVEQSNHDRVAQLVNAFAYWAAREV